MPGLFSDDPGPVTPKPSERVEIKSEGLEEVVYLDGARYSAFHLISDDYAWTNSRECAERLIKRLERE